MMIDEGQLRSSNWLRGPDLNREPPGYEPSELPLLYPAICLEQVNGIEPSSRPWQGRIITIILHLQ